MGLKESHVRLHGLKHYAENVQTHTTTERANMKKLLMTILLGLALIVPSITFAKTSDGNVLRWVEEQMEIEQSYPLPEIYRLPEDELRELYCALVAECVSVDTYPRHIMAFYHTKKDIIFLTDYEDECWEEAVLAHELVHYIQDKIYKAANETHIGQAYMEAQAYAAMEFYDEEFCKEEDRNARKNTPPYR